MSMRRAADFQANTVGDKNRRIVVALSGGVDSATAAALLVAEGYEVVGFSMRLYDAKGTAASSGGRCCGPVDLEDARQVAAHLDIPFYVVDYEKEFQAAVIDDFIAEYAAGRTPNPCVRCNERVKFAPLIERSRAIGGEALATGHYARIGGEVGRRRLLRAVDAQKDQSYFLFGMDPAALEYVRFPLGDMTKHEVRAKAKAFGLPNADKADSQEICFVPDGDYASFVERGLAHDATRGAQPADATSESDGHGGEVVDGAGRVLGVHEGVHRYTVGQRRGLRISGFDRGGEPLYVVRLEAKTRRVVLGTKADLEQRRFFVDDVRWLTPPDAAQSVLAAHVQIRHRHRPAACKIVLPSSPRSGKGAALVEVTLEAPESAVTPGQSAVFYRGDEVLGGGWIADAGASARATESDAGAGADAAARIEVEALRA